LPYLREALLFLALAGILIPLLQRMRVSQVLGFLAVGALVGPYGAGLWAGEFPWLSVVTFTRAEGIAALAEPGVLFLMFTIGLELSPARLWALRNWILGAGIGQVCFCAAISEETVERVVEAERGRRIRTLQGGAEWKGRQSGAKRGFGR
jgi:CPA2 family monovalent cation:H+ antiporter-2